jgi:hypothetical protein
MISTKLSVAAVKTPANSAFAAFAALVLVAAAPATPALAAQQNDTYISAAGGNSNTCAITSPCATLAYAVSQTAQFGTIHCLDSNDYSSIGGPATITYSMVIDCSNTAAVLGSIIIDSGAHTAEVHLIGLNIFGSGNPGIKFQNGGGTLIVEKCQLFFNNAGAGIEMATNQFGTQLFVSDTRVTGAAAGALLKPSAGSISATFDHVKLTGNFGGGLKTDTTNGSITIEITDSQFSDNLGNGINAVAGTGQNIVSIKNSIIARNGVAGIQASGANAGVLVATTLFDQNQLGATSVVSGGNMFTYGNNQIVGSIGSGFTQTAQLH